MPRRYPLVTLVILDGFGCGPPGPGKAVDLADTPVFDRLWQTFPHTTIEASGEAAGLPPGQMGNSEVGHLTIGSGRRLYQDLMRVNRSIADGSFFENPALVGAFERGKRVHLLGLVSHGGVHSHIDHLQALLRFAPEKTWIHAFTDGRDVSPTSAIRDLAELPQARIASVTGRYWAMDRDQRWERTQRAYDAIVHHVGADATDIHAAIQLSYDAGVTDEFIEPIVARDAPSLEQGDTAIFFNFRPDRGRQLTRLMLDNGFDVTTMTRYASDLDTPTAFEEQDIPETLAEVLSRHGRRQLHAAETEKYAHVTYFFNCGREQPYPGEDRILVPSQKVATYDLKPEMSAPGITDEMVGTLQAGKHQVVICNFANADMVGHTGRLDAAIAAVETLDQCLGRIVSALKAAGGRAIITADHGNAEQMWDDELKAPHTAHTSNPVPVILYDDARVGMPLRNGSLRDVSPTILALLGIPKSAEMTGTPLFEV